MKTVLPTDIFILISKKRRTLSMSTTTEPV